MIQDLRDGTVRDASQDIDVVLDIQDKFDLDVDDLDVDDIKKIYFCKNVIYLKIRLF